MPDPLRRFECREGVAAGNATGRAVAGGIIALGGVAIGSDEAIAAGLIIGGVLALSGYAQYLLDRANNDRLLAMDLLRQSVEQDTLDNRRVFAAHQEEARALNSPDFNAANPVVMAAGRKFREEIMKDAALRVDLASVQYPRLTVELASGRNDNAMRAKVSWVRRGYLFMQEEAEDNYRTLNTVTQQFA